MQQIICQIKIQAISEEDENSRSKLVAEIQKQERILKFAKFLLISSLILITCLGAVDLVLSLKSLNSDEIYLTILSLIDACIFSALTIVLVYHTLIMYCALRNFETGVIRDKCLISLMCSLFTLSYLSRCIYLFVQGITTVS